MWFSLSLFWLRLQDHLDSMGWCLLSALKNTWLYLQILFYPYSLFSLFWGLYPILKNFYYSSRILLSLPFSFWTSVGIFLLTSLLVTNFILYICFWWNGVFSSKSLCFFIWVYCFLIIEFWEFLFMLDGRSLSDTYFPIFSSHFWLIFSFCNSDL